MSEISVKLSGDNSEFRSSMQEAVGDAQKYAGELSTKVADKMVGLRDVSHAVATALGLNLESIAEQGARLFTGMSKQAEEAYGRIGELTTQLADQTIASMRIRLTEEQKLQLSLKDQEDAQKRVANAVSAENAILKSTPSLLDAITNPALALATLYARREASAKAIGQQEEALKEQIKANAEVEQLKTAEKQKQITIADKQAEYDKNAEEHAAKALDYTAQVAALENNVVTAKGLLAKAEEGSVNQATRKLELQKAEFALSDAQLKHEEAGRLAINDQISQAILLAKEKKPLTEAEFFQLQGMVQAIVDQDKWSTHLSGVEETKLEIYKLQTQEKHNQRDAEELIKKGVENLTPEEKRQLLLLQAMNDEIDKQIAKRTGILPKVQDQAKAERDSAEFQQKQTEIQQILSKGVGALTDGDKDRLKTLAGQNSVLQQQIEIVGDLTRQFENFTVAITRTGADYQSQSTTALQGVRDRLNQQLNSVSSNSGQLVKNADINSDYGAYITAQMLKGEIDNINKELTLRATITSYAKQYGESAATYKFGDADTQRAMRDQTDKLTQISQSMGTISNQLAASGLFPKNMPTPP